MNRILSIATLAVAAAMLGSLAGCHSSSSADPQQAASSTAAATAPVRVTAARPVRKTLRLESVQPGQIEAFEQTPLFAKLPAYVEKLYVDIGDRVEADQLLVDLFLPELKDELRQKEAAEVQAQAEIELAAAAVRAAEAAVATAQANISLMEAGNIRAEADVARWQSQYARIRQLVAGGSLDRKLEDETRDSLKAAEAARGRGPREGGSGQGHVCAKPGRFGEGQGQRSRGPRPPRKRGSRPVAREGPSPVHANPRPYAGVVTERNVNRGDFVQPASTMTAKPLLTVARTDIVRIFVDVPEMDSPWVEAGRTGYVSVQALPDRIVEGKVTRTSWVLGANRTLHTELDLPNPQGPAAAGDVRHRAHPSPGASRRLRPSAVRYRSRGQASVLLGGPRAAGRHEPRLPSGSRSETTWR